MFFIEKTELILITGAAEFLGGSVATQLIKEGAGGKLLFLVSAISPGQGLKILRYNLRAHGVGEVAIAELKSHQVICGDFYDVSWMERERAILMSVSRVINCALAPTFSNDSKVMTANAHGVYEFAKFFSRSWRLRRFLHVGNATGDGVETESSIGESRALETHLCKKNRVSSHLEIEKKMAADLCDLPLVVARTSTLVGHTTLGCPTPGSVFWIFRLAFALKKFTWGLEDKIDVIPVDYCANALIRLTLKSNLDYDLYHVSAGLESSCTFADVYLSFASACNAKAALESYEKVEVSVVEELALRFEARIGSGNPRLIMKSIRAANEFAKLNCVFDNRRLLGEGVSVPPRFTDYLPSCVNSSKRISITDQMQSDYNCW